MDKPNLRKFKLIRAERCHFQDILSFSRGIYNGLDYFCGVYTKWLAEEEADSSKRKNVVMVDGEGKVVGFQSYLFQDRGNKVLAQALRIDQSKKGTGLGRTFMQLCKELLLSWNKEEVAKSLYIPHNYFLSTVVLLKLDEVKSVWAHAVPKERLFDQSMGKVLGSRIARYCKISDVSDFCNKFKSIDPDLPREASLLKHGNGDDLSVIFSLCPAKFYDLFLCKGYLLIDWVYYITIMLL